MTERCSNCGGDLVSDGKWATVHRPEECEITRILTTCPEGDRLAGVLRVVRAMQERVDAEVRSQEACEDLADIERQNRKAAERERDAHRQHAIQMERTEARLMIAQIRCCSCEEFVHNLDPNCDGCGMCRPVREWLRARAKQKPKGASE